MDRLSIAGLGIDPKSAVAPYEQLRTQVVGLIRSGELAAETRLPPVRTLADRLSLAPGTVARAYRELEEDGVIQTRGRLGSFVSAHGDVTHQEAQRAARTYADRILRLGIDPDEGLSLVASALRS